MVILIVEKDVSRLNTKGVNRNGNDAYRNEQYPPERSYSDKQAKPRRIGRHCRSNDRTKQSRRNGWTPHLSRLQHPRCGPDNHLRGNPTFALVWSITTQNGTV